MRHEDSWELRMTPPKGPRVSLHLPPESASARKGRTFLRAQVAAWHLGVDTDQLDVLELLTSELITNSVVHARSELEVTANHDQRGFRVTVSDMDSRRPVLFPQDDGALAAVDSPSSMLWPMTGEWTTSPTAKPSGSGSASRRAPESTHGLQPFESACDACKRAQPDKSRASHAARRARRQSTA